MKKKIAILLIASLAISACGTGEERSSTRNAVFTPTVAGGPTLASMGNLDDLEYDEESESVYGASYFGQFGVREGLFASGGTVLDTSNADNLEPAKRFPVTNGNVIESVVPDGDGGWYLADVNNPAKWGSRNIVRINADGTLNETFAPEIVLADTPSRKEIIFFDQHPTDANSLVLVAKVQKSALVFDGEGQQCARVMIINKTTGALSKRIDLDGSCPEIATLWRGNLIFAGQFDTVFGQPRNKIAGINLTTKALTNVGSNFGAAFPAFAGANGKQLITDMRVFRDTLYVTGRLSSSGHHLTAIDLLGGAVTNWIPTGRLATTISDSNLLGHRLMVTDKAVVVAGCIGVPGSANFVAYDPITGAVRAFDPQMVLMDDYCSFANPSWNFKVTSFGTSLMMTGVQSIRGQEVPGYAWIDDTGALKTEKLSLEPIRRGMGVQQSPDVFQYFPSINRMFVGVYQTLLNRRYLGDYLSTDKQGNARLSQLENTVENWVPLNSRVRDGDIYVAGMVRLSNPQRYVLHRFDAATGQRDTGFEIDYSGFAMTSFNVADTVVALMNSNSSDNQLRIYSRDTGRLVGSFPDDFANDITGEIFKATTSGDVLYAYIRVPVANGVQWRPVRIDLRTGASVVYNVNLGPWLPSCECRPFVDGERLIVYREVNGEIEAIVIDIKSGAVERRFSNWALFGGWSPIRFGDQLVVPQVTANGLELMVVNEDNLEASKSFVLDQDLNLPSFIEKMAVSSDRLYMWINGQAEAGDGRILTGLIAFDKKGEVVSSSTPQLDGDSVVSISPVFEVAPTPSPQVEAAAGQVSIRGIEQGNRSLTVHFTSNGNQGPFEVRQVGGNKACSTTTTSCTFTKLTAYNSYSFVVEAKDRGAASLSFPSTATKPIVTVKKGKTLRLSTVIRPSTKTSVKWRVSKACKLNAAKTILTAPKKVATCTVTVSSKKGKKTIKRSISVAVA